MAEDMLTLSESCLRGYLNIIALSDLSLLYIINVTSVL